MKTDSCFVSLLDISEVLPFSRKKENEDGAILADLNRFMTIVERQFKDKIVFIGEDVIGEKFYYRFLFKKGGFVEVMTNPPVAIVAHFIEKKRANKFAEALKKTIDKTVREKKSREILKNVVEVSEGKESLGYGEWSKLRNIREL